MQLYIFDTIAYKLVNNGANSRFDKSSERHEIAFRDKSSMIAQNSTVSNAIKQVCSTPSKSSFDILKALCNLRLSHV